MRKTILTVLCLMLASMMLFANGSKDSSSSEKVVTTVCRSSYYTEEWYNAMNAAFEAETGIHVDVQPTPGNDEDHDVKVNLDLLAGGDIDVIPSLGPKHYMTRAEAGYFVALNDLVPDAAVTFGSNLPVEDDGNYYGLPFKQEMYCVFYNKDLFDGAGVSYPAGSWTWDDYVEIAKKITDPKKGIYGSFMNADSPWYFLPAKQQDIDPYKADGSSNFDAPEFAAAAQFYYDLGNVLKVQPSVEELSYEGASWNYYALAGDHLAMFPQGNWFTRLLNSQADYPHDWKYGVAPMPAAENGANNLVSMAYVSINKNAAHPDEALVYMLWLAENQWRYEGGIPAMAEFTEEEKLAVFGSIAEASEGQVTVDDLYNALIANGLGTAQSDIVGVASGEYNSICNEEFQAFNMDLQSLETTIANIVKRENEAIANAE